jgi:predicted transcriptional regulator
LDIHFTPEQEDEISRIAAYSGMDSESLVKAAVLRVMPEAAHFHAAVHEGVAQADQGELIDDEQVRQWIAAKA